MIGARPSEIVRLADVMISRAVFWAEDIPLLPTISANDIPDPNTFKALAIVRDAQRNGQRVELADLIERGCSPDYVALRVTLDRAGSVGSSSEAARGMRQALARKRAGQLVENDLPARIADGDGLATAQQVVELLRAAHDGREDSPPLETVTTTALLSEAEKPIPWVFDGLIAQADSTVIGGHAGAGKNWISDDLAMSAALGEDAFGGGIKGPGHPIKVLVATEEMSPPLIGRRLKKLAIGRGLDPALLADLPLVYLPPVGASLTDPSKRRAFFDLVGKQNPGLIVIDSLVRFSSGVDMNDAGAIAAFFAEGIAPLSRDMGAAVLILAHNRKPPSQAVKSEDLQHRLRGSSDIPAAVGCVAVLERAGTTDARTLTVTKLRWANEPTPMGLLIADTADGGVRIVATTGAADLDSLILDTLADAGPSGCLRVSILNELEERGVSRATADRNITRSLGKLTAKGRVAKLTEGRSVRYWSRDYAPKTALKGGE